MIIKHNSRSYYNKRQSINSHEHIVQSQTNANATPNSNVNATPTHNANEALSIPDNLCICELCGYITPLNFLRTISACQHCFCKRCGKHFYEDKIKQGETEFKCLYYYCLSVLSEEFLDEHIERLSQLRNSQPSDIVKGTINTANCDCLAKDSTFFTTLKDYNKKHVIDISQNDSAYLLYQKHKDYICSKCNLLSLFGKNYSNTLKCLNCLGRFCKYCLQLISSLDHFNIRSEYCSKSYKKYYNDQHWRQTINYCPKKSFRTLMMFLVTYMIILLAGCIFIRKTCRKLLCLTRKAKRVEHRFTMKKTKMIKANKPKSSSSCHLMKSLGNILYYFLVSLLWFLYIALHILSTPFYPCLYIFIEELCVSID